MLFRDSSPNRDDGVDIEAYWSDGRKTRLIRVSNPNGDVYRIYQPQTWQYVSLSPEIADDICGGFPEYWQDAPDEETKPSRDDDKQADVHRAKVISKLANCDFPIPQAFKLEETFIDELPNLTNEKRDELLSWKSSNPFALLVLHSELWWQKHGYPGHHVTSNELSWRHAATDLFRELALSEHVPRCLSALSGGQTSTPLLPDDVAHQRGPTLASQQKLEQLYRHSERRPVQWGPLFYDVATVERSHFCVAGMTRSGKSTLLRLLFQSLYQNVTPPPRFVFYDAKPDLLATMFPPGSLSGEPLDDEVATAVYLLSPFDSRGSAWDIAADAANRSRAAAIAEILFPDPDPQKRDPFYSPSARNVTTEVIIALTRTAGQKWTLYDLLCALQLENIQAVLSSTPRGRHLYSSYFEGKGKTNVPEDLINDLRTKSAKLLPAAYAWSHAKRRLGLRQWVRSQTKSIVLFNDDEHVEENNEINRILLNLLAQELLAVKKPPARTFLYLDEMEHLGRIKPIIRLTHKGADLKVNLAIAFHSLETLKEVYGGATEGILSQANFSAFLKVRSLATSDWGSRLIGTPEVKVKQKSTQRKATNQDTSEYDDDDEMRETESEHYAARCLVLPDEIRELPIPSDAKALRGYFVAPRHAPYMGTIPESKAIRSEAEYLDARYTEENFYALWPKVEGVSDHCPQPDECYELPDDTFCTLYNLGFRKPGYSPPSSEVQPADEPQEDESSQTPPPTSTQLQSPVDTGPTETPETDEPPTEEDDDVDIPDYDFGDE